MYPVIRLLPYCCRACLIEAAPSPSAPHPHQAVYSSEPWWPSAETRADHRASTPPDSTSELPASPDSPHALSPLAVRYRPTAWRCLADERGPAPPDSSTALLQ